MYKKIFFNNSRNLRLVGSLWEASSDLIIIMAHGSGSNRFAKGLFEKIAIELSKENYNVLSFDFSGHGESNDEIETIKNLNDDLSSAISFVKKNKYKRIALFGHSLGALICLQAYSKEIETMVLLGALTGPVKWQWKDLCTPEQLKEIKEKGYLTHIVNDGLRKSIRIDANLLKDISEIDQEKILKKITCPILIIHGDSDRQELDLLEYSKKAILLLNKESKLIIIKNTSHLFLENIDEVILLTKNWYKKHFPIL